MEMVIYLVCLLLLTAMVVFFLRSRRRNRRPVQPLPPGFRDILSKRVAFYQQLSPEAQREFETRMAQFLSQVAITGIKTDVTDEDRVLIAASAVIPIFQFPGWEYVNLHEVLLYPDAFSHEFQWQGQNRSVVGMVGNGPMNRVMILSQHDLRQAFASTTSPENPAIHEFVHLVDKTDGVVDGIPAFILDKQYILPWLQLMHREIRRILDNQSDINPYGATNEAEFFAVVSEYFFQRPDLLREKHPELFQLLERIFRREGLSTIEINQKL